MTNQGDITPEELLAQYRRQLDEANYNLATARAHLEKRKDELANIKTTVSQYEKMVEENEHISPDFPPPGSAHY